MSFKVTINGNDISNYVKAPNPVPYVNRNRDFTPIASEINLLISKKSSSLPSVGHEVNIFRSTSSAYPFFAGIIKECKYDKWTRYYRCTVAHILSKLKEKVINYETLHTSISAGANAIQYNAEDNEGYPNVQVIYLIKNMFDLSGLGVDLSHIESLLVEEMEFTITYTITGTTAGASTTHIFSSTVPELSSKIKFSGFTGDWAALNGKVYQVTAVDAGGFDISEDTSGFSGSGTGLATIVYDVFVKDLYLDENMLYAINQTVAVNHTTLDADAKYRINQITFFDFFREFCSMIGSIKNSKMGFNVVLTDSGVIKTIEIFLRSDDVITVTNDASYKREESNIVGEPGGYAWNFQLSTDRSKYASGTPSSLNAVEFTSGDGKNLLQHFNNLVFMYHKQTGNDGDLWGLGDYPSYTFPVAKLLENKRKAVTADFDVVKLESTVQYISSAKSCMIDLKEQKSIIVQELES